MLQAKLVIVKSLSPKFKHLVGESLEHSIGLLTRLIELPQGGSLAVTDRAAVIDEALQLLQFQRI